MYTPGLWRASRCYGFSFLIEPNIAWIDASSSKTKETREANANLIAAAPELLQACELIELWMLGGQPRPHSYFVVLEQVQAAIRKAKGV